MGPRARRAAERRPRGGRLRRRDRGVPPGRRRAAAGRRPWTTSRCWATRCPAWSPMRSGTGSTRRAPSSSGTRPAGTWPPGRPPGTGCRPDSPWHRGDGAAGRGGGAGRGARPRALGAARPGRPRGRARCWAGRPTSSRSGTPPPTRPGCCRPAYRPSWCTATRDEDVPVEVSRAYRDAAAAAGDDVTAARARRRRPHVPGRPRLRRLARRPRPPSPPSTARHSTPVIMTRLRPARARVHRSCRSRDRTAGRARGASGGRPRWGRPRG